MNSSSSWTPTEAPSFASSWLDGDEQQDEIMNTTTNTSVNTSITTDPYVSPYLVEYAPYSLPLGTAMLVLLYTSSILSLLGSSCIVYMARRKMKEQIMHRLLFYIASSDIFMSLVLLVTPIMLPSDLPLPTNINQGNDATCAAQGYILTTLIWTGCCYNCFLSLYYLATVRYNWKEATVSRYDMERRKCACAASLKWWEWTAHGCVAMVPLSVCSMAAAYQLFNPPPLLPFCYMATYPYGCTEFLHAQTEQASGNELFIVTEQDEIQMDFCDHFGLVEPLIQVAAMAQALVTGVSILATFAVYWTVRQKMKQSNAFQFQTTTTTTNSATNSATTNNNNSTNNHSTASRQNTITSAIRAATSAIITGSTKSNHATSTTTESQQPPQSRELSSFEKRILQVRTQAILYTLIYINSGIWFVLIGGISATMDSQELQDSKNAGALAILQCITALLAPLNGFLNFFVYIRTKLARWRTVEPDRSWAWCVYQILQDVPIPTAAQAKRQRQEQVLETNKKNSMDPPGAAAAAAAAMHGRSSNISSTARTTIASVAILEDIPEANNQLVAVVEEKEDNPKEQEQQP